MTAEHGYDAGIIAEAIFYYQNVHLLIDHGALQGLLATIGPDNLLRLIEEEFVTATHIRDSLGTQTVSTALVPTYRFSEFHFTGTEKKPKLSATERVEFLFERSLGKGWKTRQFAKRFAKRVPVVALSQGSGRPDGIPGMALDDLADKAYVRGAIEEVVRCRIPGYQLPPKWDFEIVRGKDDFAIWSDLNFAELTTELRRRAGRDRNEITMAHLINPILDARADMYLTAKYMAELVTRSEISNIIQLRFADILMKREKNRGEIETFQNVALQNARAIREAVNDGVISFSDFLDLVEESRRFRQWLKDVNPDQKLIAEYIDSISKGTWAEKLSVRIARFAVFTAIGLVEPISGLLLGAADQFLFEKIFRGWKPHQFVQDHLRPSLNKEA